MSTYMVIDADTAEIMREHITSEQLQAADRLLHAADRLNLHQVAASHANARDRAVRYGNAYKHPDGVVKPSGTLPSPRRTPKLSPRPESMHHALTDLAGGLVTQTGKVLLECCSFGLLATTSKKRR